MSPRGNPGAPIPPLRSAMGIILFIGAIILLTLAWRGIEMLTDWWWFQEVGFERVFSVTFLTQLKVGAIFGLVFFVIFYLNLFLANRFSAQGYWVDKDELIHIPPWEAGGQPLGKLILLASVLFGLFAALRGSAQWENFLQFFNATPFQVSDPLFNRDIGFYVFQLPLLQAIYRWLMTVFVLTALAVGFLYFLRRSFQFIPPRTLRVAPAARIHLSILIACLFFVGAGGVWLELNELLYSKRGIVFGPGYADVTTQLWVLKLLMAVTGICGLSILAYIVRRDWRIPAVAVAAFLIVSVVGTGIYPSIVQKFKVVPNEIVLEKPYLERNIKYTRMAYRLKDIEDREFPARRTSPRRI